MNSTENVYNQLELLRLENLKFKQELNSLKETLLQYQKVETKNFSGKPMPGDIFGNPLQMYRLIVETADEGIWLCDKEARIIFVNKRLTEMLGYSHEEMIGKIAFEFISPDELENSINNFERRLAGFKDQYEKKIRCKNGSFIWTSITALPFKDSSGNIIGALGMITDITENKRYQEELKESEEKFSSAFKSNPNALVLSRVEDGTIIDINETFLKLFEWDRREVLERTSLALNMFDHEEERNKVISLLKKEGHVRNFEINVKLKSGEIRNVLLSTEFIQTGNQKNMLTTIQDITDRKKIEKELQESKEQYKVLFESIDEGYCVIEMKIEPGEPLDYRFIEINESFEKQSTLENAKGKWMRELRPDHEESWFEIYRDIALTGKPRRFEHGGKALDNRWFTLYAFRIGAPEQKRVAVIFNDISAKKIAENQLRLSEERFRTLVTASSQVLYRMSPDWSEMYQLHSRGFLANTEKPNKNWLNEYIHPDDQIYVSNAIKIAIETKSVFELEHRVKKTDETWGWTFSRAVPMLDENGNIQEWFGAANDITEARLSAETIKRNETLLKQAGFLANLGAWELEFEGNNNINENPLRWSEQVYRIFGYKQGDIIVTNQLFFERIHPADREMVRNAVAEALSEKKPYYIEHRIIRADNVERTVLEHAEILFDAHGNPVRMIGAVQDITEQKMARESVINSEIKFRRLFETMTQGVIYYDNKGKAISANAGAEKILGKSFEQMAEETANGSFFPAVLEDLTVITPETHPVNMAIQTGTPVYDRVIGMFNVNEQQLKWVLMSVVPHDTESVDTAHAFSVFSDITERKLAEIELNKKNRELKAAYEKAEENDKLKSAFIANLSHEIRTPMNGILGFAELLKNDALSEESQKLYLETITNSGNRMLDIIYDLVDISKLETGQIHVKPEIFDVSTKIDKLYRIFQPEANKKGVTLKAVIQLPPDKMRIKADRSKLLRVLSNLLKNALRFTYSGSIEFGCKLKSNNYLFYVKDTGLGIKKEQQSIIFNSFRQGDTTHSGIHEGTGLGLTICKSYVELMGGNISVESTPLKGSTFSFTIPINGDFKNTGIEDDSTANMTEVPPIGTAQKRSDYTTVLVAEDEDEIYFYLQELLKLYGIKTVYARDGIEAIEIIKNNKPIDLILMDIKMPRMDGLEATRQIRTFRPDIPIIAQTAFNTDEDIQNALKAGCNDHISKPFNKDVLLKKIWQNVKSQKNEIKLNI